MEKEAREADSELAAKHHVADRSLTELMSDCRRLYLLRPEFVRQYLEWKQVDEEGVELVLSHIVQTDDSPFVRADDSLVNKPAQSGKADSLLAVGKLVSDRGVEVSSASKALVSRTAKVVSKPIISNIGKPIEEVISGVAKDFSSDIWQQRSMKDSFRLEETTPLLQTLDTGSRDPSRPLEQTLEVANDQHMGISQRVSIVVEEDENESVASINNDQLGDCSSFCAVLKSRADRFLRHVSLELLCVAFLLILVPSLLFRGKIHWNSVPMHVVLPWIIAFYLLGHEHGSSNWVRDRQGYTPIHPSVSDLETIVSPSTSARDSVKHDMSTNIQADKIHDEKQNVFKRARQWFRRREVSSKRMMMRSTGSSSERYWTNLRQGRPMFEKWKTQQTLETPAESALGKHLLRVYPHFRTTNATEHEQPERASQKSSSPESDDLVAHDRSQEFALNYDMGSFDLVGDIGDSMRELVVNPLWKVRGMDVFLGPSGEGELGTHPFLIKNGLRDVPCCIVNSMLAFGNIVMYFTLPEWVKDWSDSVEEHDEDPDDVKALKRFFNGDDVYRNERIMIIPGLIEAPLPIRVIAPGREAFTVHGEYASVSWRKREREKEKSGRVLEPLLEMEIDCVSNQLMRKMSAIIKRSLRAIKIDLAAVIEQPDVEDEASAVNIEKEPSACLGLWRFDNVDLRGSSSLPPRRDDVQEALAFLSQ